MLELAPPTAWAWFVATHLGHLSLDELASEIGDGSSRSTHRKRQATVAFDPEDERLITEPRADDRATRPRRPLLTLNLSAHVQVNSRSAEHVRLSQVDSVEIPIMRLERLDVATSRHKRGHDS